MPRPDDRAAPQSRSRAGTSPGARLDASFYRKRRRPADQRAVYVTAHVNAHWLADVLQRRTGGGGGYAENAARQAEYVEAHRWEGVIDEA